jgi:hypothetical protein
LRTGEQYGEVARIAFPFLPLFGGEESTLRETLGLFRSDSEQARRKFTEPPLEALAAGGLSAVAAAAPSPSSASSNRASCHNKLTRYAKEKKLKNKN